MFGKRLHNLRESKNMTQTKLAKLVSLSQQTIDHYEKGRAKPNIDTITMFADIFGISADYLLGRTNELEVSSMITAEPENKVRAVDKYDSELAILWDEISQREDLKIMFKQAVKLNPDSIQYVVKYMKMIEKDETRNSI